LVKLKKHQQNLYLVDVFFMNPTQQHILNQKEPYQSIMLYVRSVIFKTIPTVEEHYKYKVP